MRSLGGWRGEGVWSAPDVGTFPGALHTKSCSALESVEDFIGGQCRCQLPSTPQKALLRWSPWRRCEELEVGRGGWGSGCQTSPHSTKELFFVGSPWKLRERVGVGGGGGGGGGGFGQEGRKEGDDVVQDD